MRLYIFVNSLLKLLHLLVVLGHVLTIDQWRQEAICWILVLKRRWLL